MNSLTTFNYLSSNIRVVEIDGLALFAASDACAALRYANPTDAIRRHVGPSQVRNLAKREVRDQGFPNRGMTFVTEAGLYDLIFGSTLPYAQEMKHWVTREVLPAILQRMVERQRAEKEAAELSPEISGVWFTLVTVAQKAGFDERKAPPDFEMARDGFARRTMG
ncbi:BRO family protein [Rhizobium sp. ZX09]|uniref:BRO-N domain-containing protein n=1 Tax=Rhizobium sp. ZX09 TaxID=2291939 RepID=UPI001A98A925|nr:BRO family protein [Rhizobium sp. ZX09]